MKNKVMNQLRASKGTRCSQMAIIMWIEKRTIDTHTCKKPVVVILKFILVHQVIGTATTLTTSAEKENET
jgi:hypothetical protein